MELLPISGQLCYRRTVIFFLSSLPTVLSANPTSQALTPTPSQAVASIAHSEATCNICFCAWLKQLDYLPASLCETQGERSDSYHTNEDIEALNRTCSVLPTCYRACHMWFLKIKMLNDPRLDPMWCYWETVTWKSWSLTAGRQVIGAILLKWRMEARSLIFLSLLINLIPLCVSNHNVLICNEAQRNLFL